MLEHISHNAKKVEKWS